MSSLGNLALRMCHRSVLFARNPQWTFFTAVNTTWQDFIGVLLEADTPLGTFLTQVSTGTNASLLQFAPPWAKFGSSRSVCLLPFILHKFVLPPLNDSFSFFILSEGWERETSGLRGRKRRRGRWIKKNRQRCVFIKRFIVGALIQDQLTLSDQWERYDQGKPAVTEPRSAVGKDG